MKEKAEPPPPPRRNLASISNSTSSEVRAENLHFIKFTLAAHTHPLGVKMKCEIVH